MAPGFQKYALQFLDSLNIFALLGWTYLGYLVCTTPSVTLMVIVTPLASILEAICIIEVIRILAGNLPGNALFGVLLHAIRFITLFGVLPQIDTNYDSGNANFPPWISTAILGSWSLTEVGRYPMYIWKTSKVARFARMMIPVLTFPIACGTEAYAAWLVLMSKIGNAQQQTQYLSGLNVFFTLAFKMLLVGLLCTNVILGPIMAYPHIIKKFVQEKNKQH